MAVTVAHSDVAMKKWLRIVGAERSGRTAVPHRHGKSVDLYSAQLFSAFLRGGSKPVKGLPVLLPQPLHYNATTVKLLDLGANADVQRSMIN